MVLNKAERIGGKGKACQSHACQAHHPPAAHTPSIPTCLFYYWIAEWWGSGLQSLWMILADIGALL